MLVVLLLTDLISQSGVDEAEQNFIGFSGFFGFRLVHDPHHFIDALRQKRKALHLVDVVSVLVSFSSPEKKRTKEKEQEKKSVLLDSPGHSYKCFRFHILLQAETAVCFYLFIFYFTNV